MVLGYAYQATVYAAETFPDKKGLPLKQILMKKIILPVLLIMVLTSAAQQKWEDAVYLKNGSVLRGKLLQPPGTEQLKIELHGGSIWVLNTADIDSIKKENGHKRRLAELKSNYYRKNTGYRNITELGIVYGPSQPNDNSNYYYHQTDDIGLSIHTINGYQFWPYLFVGAGMGIDRYINYRQTFSPFYLRVTSEFLKRRVTPYVFGDAGYALMWQQKDNEFISYRNKGGYYVQAGGGVRIYTASRASVMLGLAYKRQYSETKWWYNNMENEGPTYRIQRTYQRVAFQIGVTF